MFRFGCRQFSTIIKGFNRPLYLHDNTLLFSKDVKDTGSIIGWTKSKDLPMDSLHIGFRDNPEMKKQIFEIIRRHAYRSPYLISMAETWQSGWMHIADGRSLAAFGRCPEPDDILATVLVQDGLMIPDSIQEIPTHRLLTVNGLFQLPADLDMLLFEK